MFLEKRARARVASIRCGLISMYNVLIRPPFPAPSRDKPADALSLRLAEENIALAKESVKSSIEAIPRVETRGFRDREIAPRDLSRGVGRLNQPASHELVSSNQIG